MTRHDLVFLAPPHAPHEAIAWMRRGDRAFHVRSRLHDGVRLVRVQRGLDGPGDFDRLVTGYIGGPWEWAPRDRLKQGVTTQVLSVHEDGPVGVVDPEGAYWLDPTRAPDTDGFTVSAGPRNRTGYLSGWLGDGDLPWDRFDREYPYLLAEGKAPTGRWDGHEHARLAEALGPLAASFPALVPSPTPWQRALAAPRRGPQSYTDAMSGHLTWGYTGGGVVSSRRAPNR